MIAILLFFILMAIPYFAILITIIGLCKNPSQWKKYSFFFVYFIFIIAYVYEPIGTPDLVRYFELMSRYGQMPFFNGVLRTAEDPFIQIFLIWLFGKLGLPHLLPAISTAAVYSAAIYITGDIAEQYKMQKYIPVIILYQMMMIPFLNTVSNVFNIWAFSIVTLTAYLDIIKKKKGAVIIILYISSCFLHEAAVVLVALRLLLFLINKYKIIVVAFLLLINPALNAAFANVNRLGNSGVIYILKLLIKKAYWYFNDPLESEYSIRIASSFAYKIDRYTMVSLAVLFIVLIHNLKVQNDDQAKFNDFVFLLCIVTIVMFPVNTPQYWRSAASTAVCSASVLIPALAEYRQTRKTGVLTILYILPVYMILGLLLQVWNARFIVDITQILTDALLNNAYTVFFRIIRSLISL